MARCGIATVIVNGKVVLDEGKHTDARPGRDLLVSSWAGLPLATTDFGLELGGCPGLVRRPNLPPAPVCYLLPKTAEGHVDVAVCATPRNHEVLRADAQWATYAEYIG